MYTTFSLIFMFIISPLNWVLVLILISLFSKKPKRKKTTLIIAFVLLFVFSNRFLLEMYSRAWNVTPVPLEKGKTYSAAIVLGGFSSEDRNGAGFFNERADRFIEAMRLKSTGKVSYIMMSGGNAFPTPEGFTEAAYVRQSLREMNFPDSVILSEGKSTNTVTNAKFTKQVLEAKHLKSPYLLVTSAYHMRRAMYIFKKNGMDVIPCPCDYIGGNNKMTWSDWVYPNVNILFNWSYYIKEFFGLIVAHIQST